MCRRSLDRRSSSPFGATKRVVAQHFLRQFRRAVVKAAHKGRSFAGLFQLAYTQSSKRQPPTSPHHRRNSTMEHTLPPLPYAKNALAPHMSEETLEFHYGKHHQAYVTNLN